MKKKLLWNIQYSLSGNFRKNREDRGEEIIRGLQTTLYLSKAVRSANGC